METTPPTACRPVPPTAWVCRSGRHSTRPAQVSTAGLTAPWPRQWRRCSTWLSVGCKVAFAVSTRTSPLLRLRLEAGQRRPCPHPGSAMPHKSLERVYGRTSCNSISLRRASLATAVVLEGTRFRLTQEGSLLFLVQQSCPTAALPSPRTTPACRALGGAPALGGRCTAPGQSRKAARHLDGSGQPRTCWGPLLPTAWVQRDWATQALGGGRPGCPIGPGSICPWRPGPQPISDLQTGLISWG